MRCSLSYAVAGLLCWLTMTPTFAQNKNAPPGPDPSQNPDNKITAESKLNGKTLKEWVADIKPPDNKAPDPSLQRLAMQNVIPYGRLARKEAVPAIISVLNNRFPYPEVSMKVYGAMALGLIGLDERDLKSGVQCLIDLLADPQASVRRYAVGALSSLGPDARAAIPDLAKLIKTREDSETRQAAVNALAVMAWDKTGKEGPDPRAFRALAGALSDHCIQVRYDAIKALITIGPPPISSDARGKMANADRNAAINKLQELTAHGDKVQAVWAHMALMRMDPSQINDSNLKAMVKILDRGDSHVRRNAADALSMAWRLARKYPNPPNPSALPPKGAWAAAVNALIKLLSDKDLEIVFSGINALGEFESAAMKAKPQLETLAQHKDPLIQRAATAALEKITGIERRNLGEARE